MYVWTVLPFGWNESPFVYQTVSGVRSQFLRSRGIPTVTYIDDAWQCSPVAGRAKEPREQWLAAAEGLRLAVALSAYAGFCLSIAKCDLIPTLSLRYLGLICDSGQTVFRVPSDKLCGLRELILKVLSEGKVPLSTLGKIAGKCTPMKVAIRLASRGLTTCLRRFERPSAPATVSGRIACESRVGAACARSTSCGTD